MRGFKYFSRLMSFVHSYILLSSLYMGIGSYYGYLAGQEIQEIIKVWSVSILLIVPLIVSEAGAKLIRNMYLYLALGIGTSAGIHHVSKYMAEHVTMAVQGECSIISVLSFALSMLTFLVYTRAYIKRAESEWGDSDAPVEEVIYNFLNWPDVKHTIVYIFPYVCAIYTKHLGYIQALFAFFAIDVFIMFLHRGSAAFTEFMFKNRRSSNIPVASITRMIVIAMAAGVLLILLFMVPAFMLGHEPLVGMELKKHDRTAAAPIIHMEDYAGDVVTPEDGTIEDYGDFQMPAVPEWLITLWNISMLLLILGSIALIIWIIVSFMRNSSRAFAGRFEDEDQVEFIDSSIDKAIFSINFNKQAEGLFSPKQQIRSRYKKLIKKRSEKSVRDSNTPWQLEEAAGLGDNADRRRLHELYEKARYSQEEVSLADAKEVRAMKL